MVLAPSSILTVTIERRGHQGVGHSFTNPRVMTLGMDGFAFDAAAADRRSCAGDARPARPARRDGWARFLTLQQFSLTFGEIQSGVRPQSYVWKSGLSLAAGARRSRTRTASAWSHGEGSPRRVSSSKR
jgi:hypothetical protein